MTELLGTPYSAWTEKARWALDARRVPYAFKVYAPLVGELALRLKLRKWTGLVSVPVLTDDVGTVIADSAAIARWGDSRGEGPTLFPPAHEAETARFIELSEWGLAAGRALSLARVLGDREALVELVPHAMRKSLGAIGVRVSEFGVKRTLRKYGAPSAEQAARSITAVLDELRNALAASPAPSGPSAVRTLCGQFAFADIAMAQVLTFVEPPAFGLRLGPASRRNYGDPALRERYADLVAWRDALYEAHRPR